MTVDLAAQVYIWMHDCMSVAIDFYKVLSNQVAVAMKDSGNEDLTETIKFVDYFDKFDSLNVNNFSTGMQKKKAFKQPYTSGKDL